MQRQFQLDQLRMSSIGPDTPVGSLVWIVHTRQEFAKAAMVAQFLNDPDARCLVHLDAGEGFHTRFVCDKNTPSQVQMLPIKGVPTVVLEGPFLAQGHERIGTLILGRDGAWLMVRFTDRDGSVDPCFLNLITHTLEAHYPDGKTLCVNEWSIGIGTGAERQVITATTDNA